MKFFRYLLLTIAALLLMGQPLFSQQLKLTSLDTIVCAGSDVMLEADYGSVSNLSWEYYSESVSDFTVFSRKLVTQNAFTMNEPCCFRVSALLNGERIYSNVVCVSMLTQYESNWYMGDEKIESGHTLEVCGNVRDFTFTSHSTEWDRQFYDDLWFMDGVLASTDTMLLVPEFSKDCQVVHVKDSKVCASDTFVFNFKSIPAPSIVLIDHSGDGEWLCHGDSVRISAKVTNGSFVEWHAYPIADGWLPLEDELNKKRMEGDSTSIWFKPKYASELNPGDQVPYFYLVEASTYLMVDGKKQCATSDQLEFLVDPHYHSMMPDSFLSCEGDAPIRLSTFEGLDERDSLTMSWAKTVEWYQNGTLISSDYAVSLSDYADGTKITQVVKGNACPDYRKEFYLGVKSIPSLFVEDATVCLGDSATLKAHYDSDLTCKWYKSNGSLVGEGPQLSLLPSEDADYYAEVANTGLSTRCMAKESAVVRVSAPPRITSHNKINETMYELTTEGGQGVLSFDYGFGTTTHDVLTVSPASEYTVVVTDELGCSSSYQFSTEGYEIEIPPYFIANRENWVIGNFERFDRAIIEIFDRTGKLLLRTQEFEQGWDGTYCGTAMPSTDYWFVLTLPSADRQITGHFTLLRE